MLKPALVYLFFCICLLSLTQCQKDKVEPLSPVKTTDLIGIWQLKMASTVIKGTVNGTPQNINQKRDGTPDEFLQFLNDGGVASDPADIFGTGTYGWRVFIDNGNDLTLRKGSAGNKDFGYFTIRVNANQMKWTMSKEQAIKSSQDSEGFSSVLNGSTDIFDDLQEFNLTLEFTKVK